MKQRKQYATGQKIIILRELLENNVSFGQLIEKYQVSPNYIYYRMKSLIRSAKDIFRPKVCNTKLLSAEHRKIEKLQSKLKDRDKAISSLLRENIEIKACASMK